jgi:putative radical SAM enzyme (TIGR03279 family)
MLRNPNAGKSLENLKWLRKNKIPFHAQIVLCPGINDGKELERTLTDLAQLKNTVLSTAIVPVGITQFREEKLKRVDSKCAKETIEIASKFRRVCCSDEFFLLADEPIPPAKYYGNFCQLDDGVGALRLTYDDFKKLNLPKSVSKPYKIIFACSYAAKNMLEKVAKKLSKIKNLTVEAYPVKSNYWGEDITVAGLITTDDLIAAVKDIDCDTVIIPTVMLRPYSEDFLDGKNLDYVRKKSGKNFFVQKNIYSLREVVEFIENI